MSQLYHLPIERTNRHTVIILADGISTATNDLCKAAITFLWVAEFSRLRIVTFNCFVHISRSR